jgi:hypothetical protein
MHRLYIFGHKDDALRGDHGRHWLSDPHWLAAVGVVVLSLINWDIPPPPGDERAIGSQK